MKLAPRRERLAEALAVATGWRLDSMVDYLAGRLSVGGAPVPPARALREGDPKLCDPRACWETLATRDLIPFDWVEDERRRFACGCNLEMRSGCERCGGSLLLAHPSTVEVCVALASDVPGVLAVERLALDHVVYQRETYRWQPVEGIVWAPMVETEPSGFAPLEPVTGRVRSLGYETRGTHNGRAVLFVPPLAEAP